MKQTVLSVLFIAVLALGSAGIHRAFAFEYEAGSAAKLAFHIPVVDARLTQLTAYLQSMDSPLTPYADWFISEADRNSLDWKLVAAIAGVESTFGKQIPYGSYNGWGWGIPTGAQSGIVFADWKDGITEVSEGLRKNYLDRGATSIEQIGRIYAASPAWPWKVQYFLSQIDSYQPNHPELIKVNL